MKKRLYMRLAAFSAAAAAGSSAFAVGVDPITTLLTAVDLSTVAVSVAAATLLIIGIALAFKAPDVTKRVIRKV
jgi:hypothetical protein